MLWLCRGGRYQKGWLPAADQAGMGRRWPLGIWPSTEHAGKQEGSSPVLQECWATFIGTWADGRDTSEQRESRQSVKHCLKEERGWIKVLKAIKQLKTSDTKPKRCNSLYQI